ncbi:MAG: hypothetical protein IJ292_01410 [Clostridia bacterium]|nr:hypothetical protein [Clostridia bacterium]
MTLKEAVTKFDSICRNTLPEGLKVDWISLLDSTIYNEIILTHENYEKVSFSPYTANTPDDTVLLVPDPYSELYLKYLTMKKDLHLADISRYNNSLLLFSTAYTDFENFYNSKNMPIKKVDYFNI